MIDPQRYLDAASELENEAERHIATAEKCRVASAALRELAGEVPDDRLKASAEPSPRKRAIRKKSAARRKRTVRAKAATKKVRARVNQGQNATILCACGCGKTVPLTRKGRQPTRFNGHWSKRPKAAPPAAPSNGPAPATPPPEPIRANRIEETRASSRFRCPKHGAECRTPTLCKTQYTRPS